MPTIEVKEDDSNDDENDGNNTESDNRDSNPKMTYFEQKIYLQKVKHELIYNKKNNAHQ